MRVSLIPTVATLVVLSATVSLGNWQMRRAAEKEALQMQRDAALESAPLQVGASPASAADVDGRRVEVHGTFSPAHTVFLDNRTRQGIAGFHVFTPMRLGSASDPQRWVLVLRGWVAQHAADRNRLPEVPTPLEPVRVQGLAQAHLAQALSLGAVSAPGPDDRLWSLLTLQRYAQWSGLPLQPFVLRQTSELSDGLARDWVEPGGGVAKHRGYAFQWYALAAATAALWLWFALRTTPADARQDRA
jgi:surfeit locus 1 family protein